MKQKDCKILVGINKDTDQLHYIHAAHLCLFFHLQRTEFLMMPDYFLRTSGFKMDFDHNENYL